MVNTKKGKQNTNLKTLSVSSGPGLLYPDQSPSSSRFSGLFILIILLALLFVPEVRVKGQCGVGYTLTTIDGSGSVVTYQTGLLSPELILGDPDGSGADIHDGSDVLDLDLLYTLNAGEQYTIHWRQKPGESGTSRLNFYESPDGTNWTEHPLSASEFFGTTSETSFETALITASINTRYIRFFKKPTRRDYEVDAVTFTADVCLVDPSCSIGSVENLVSGYGNSVDDENGIVDEDYILGAPDGEGARIDDPGDWIVIQLDDTIPGGQEYTVIYKRNPTTTNPARLYFDESIDASNWNEHSHSGAPVTETSDIDFYVSHTVIAETDLYYLRFRHFGDVAMGDYWVDAIVFNAYECLPTASISPDPASVCVSRNLILDGNPQGGTGTYTHEWSGTGSGSLSATNVQTPTFSNPATGSYNLTYKVTDSDGYSATDNISVSVVVDSPPIASCQDITVYLNAAGTVPIVAGDVDDGSYDVCGTVTLSIDITSFDCDDVGDNIVTLTVEDDNSQTSTCQATVTVVDALNPTITCPAPLSVNNDAGVCTAVVNGIAPTVGDNCGVTLQTWALTGATTANSAATGINDASGQTFNVGVTTVTYYIEDAAGNSIQCNFNVTVLDNEAPTITCPAPLSVNNDAGVCTAVVNGIAPTVGDNCGVTLQTWALTGATTANSAATGINDASGQTFNVGVTTVTYYIEDAAGNSIQCNFNVTVLDNEAPQFTVPPTATVCMAIDCSYDIDPSITGDVIDESDNCATGIEAIYRDSIVIVGSCNIAAQVIRIWSLDDGNGNVVRKDQTIWINPISKVEPIVSETVLCDSSVTQIELTSPNIFSTGVVSFNYTVVATGGVYGFTTPVNGLDTGYIITDQLINPSLDIQTVTYTITPVSPVGCLNGDPVNVVLTINPSPRLTIDIPELIYCDSSIVSFDVTDGLLSSTGTTVYKVYREYNSDSINIAGENPDWDPEYQDYTIPLEDNVQNLTNQEQTITYKFKALIQEPKGVGSSDCDHGLDTTIVITINPTPRLRVELSDVIYCDSSSISFNVVDSLLNSTGSTAYHLTREYDINQVHIEGENPGTESNQVYGLFSDEVRNLTLDTVNIIYKFKPIIVDPRGDGSTDCEQGEETTLVITLNPTPRLTVDVDPLVYCDSTNVSFAIADGINSSTGPTVYRVTREYNPDSVHIEGETPGPDDNLVYGTDLTDQIRNLSKEYQEIKYTFKALIKNPRGDGSLVECDQGVDTTVIIYLNPTPDIEVDIVNDTICNEDIITLNIRNPNFPIIGEWRYRVEVDYGDSILGTLPELPLFMDFGAAMNTVSDTLENIGLEYDIVTYTFTPYIQSNWGGDSCMNFKDTTITVWVNPTPAIRVIAEDTVICNGETTEISIHNPNKFVYGDWIYDLVVVPDDTVMVSGYMDSDTARSDVDPIVQTLYNSDTVAHSVEYRFYPRKTIEDSLICAGGNDTTITIWINPTPEIRVKASDLEICDGDTVTLDIRNPNVDVRGVWYYDLEISKTSEKVLGVTSGTEPFNTSDTTYTYALINNDTVAHQVTYFFRPQISPDDNGLDCWGGIDYDTSITITILPTPEIRVDIADTLLCDGQWATFIVENPNNNLYFADWWYELRVSNPSGMIIGENQDSTFLPGQDLNFSDNLFNTDTIVHEIVYQFIPRIRPSDGGLACDNGRDTTITVWVNPSPRVFNTVEDSIVCNNEYAHFFSSDGLGEIYGVSKYIVQVDYIPSLVQVIGKPSGSLSQDTLIAGESFSDSLVNLTNSVQTVFYKFFPRIFDDRPTHFGEYCSKQGDPFVIPIKVNPTPKLLVSLDDTIVCDTAIFEIEMDNLLGSVEGTPVYDLEVTYNASAVSALVSEADGEVPAGRHLTNILKNNSDTVQVIAFNFIARIRDDRPGQVDCRRGTDTTIYVYLNPTPRLDYRYLQGQDTLCYLEGFELSTNPLVKATSEIYYRLGVTSDGLGGVIVPPDSSDASSILIQDLINPLLRVGTVEYSFTPFITSEGCLGKDTSILISVNPEPVMEATQSDTAVCHNWGYTLPMTHPIISTTGAMQYQLSTGGYDAGNLLGSIPPDNNYFIDTLDQTDVLNTGEFIEDVAYYIRPFIDNARQDLGSGPHCWGDSLETIIVQVAPELKGEPWADTADYGGWEIRCFGLMSDSIHSGVKGGYYRLPYTQFDWSTSDGTDQLLNDGDSTQFGLGVGEYEYYVKDEIGCDYSSMALLIEQPDTIEVDTTLTKPSCAADGRDDGAIEIDVVGGTSAYSYEWDAPFGYTYYTEDLFNMVGGQYYLALSDMNGCEYNAEYRLQSAKDILITPEYSDYFGFGVECYDDTNGFIKLSVSGGFAPYRIEVDDLDAGDTFVAGIINTEEGELLVPNLDSGIYILHAYDQEECYNETKPEIEITQPLPINVWKDNAKYSDTVDISCYGADDGEIHLAMTGGRTAMYSNLFTWTGPGGLVQNDSIQSGLEPGLYTVTVTDTAGCVGDSSFMLIEPTQITMLADEISDYNSWNISCYNLSDGFIDISSQGGIMGHTYDWSSNDMILADTTLEDQPGLIEGTYNVTITDDIGCTLDTFFTLAQPNPIDIDTIIPTFSTFAIACADSSTGQITVIPFGGADSSRNTYTWDLPGGGQIDGDSVQSGLSAGIYSLRVTDVNGCDSTWSFTLNQPTPIAFDGPSADSARCADSPTGNLWLEVSGGIPEYTYLWSGDQMDYYTQDPDSVFAGFYTLAVTDANECVKTDTISVGEADLFGVQMLVSSDFNGTPISCADSSDAVISIEPIGGLGPYSFDWNTGAATQELNGIGEGAYKVIVYDWYGCVDSAEVELSEPLQLEFNMQSEGPLCYGESNGQIELLLSGGTVNTFDDYRVWVNDDFREPYIYDLPAGNYDIEIRDLNDCIQDTIAVLIQNDSLELTFETVDADCPEAIDGELRLYIEGGDEDRPYMVEWNQGLGVNQTYFYELQSGEYIAKVTDWNSCVTIDTVEVGFIYETCLGNIINAFSPNGDGINETWVIENIEFYPQAVLKIFDRWGNMVYYTSNVAGEPWDGRYNGNVLPLDSYHYVLDLNFKDYEPKTGSVTIVR